MSFTIKSPPEFSLEIEQWNRDTLADGVEMAKIPETLLNNDVYLKEQMERQEHVRLITLTASGWTGSAAPYVQTASVSGAVEGVEPVVVSALEDGAALAVQKAYIKAFGIVCGGTAALENGTAVFKVYKKPAADIKIGLRGVTVNG